VCEERAARSEALDLREARRRDLLQDDGKREAELLREAVGRGV
jgi:hypothetical protein